MACEEKGLEVEFVRMNEFVLEACTVCNGFCHPQWDYCPHKDDAHFLMKHFLESDGYIIGAPVYSKTPCSLAMVFRDRCFGPKMDRGAWLKRGEPEWAQGGSKNRAGGLISVGGAPSHHWVSLGIQSLYTTCFSAQTTVVDLMDVMCHADMGAAAIDDELIARAHRLGESVADAVITGDNAWRGDDGYACPICHQNFVELKPGTNKTECPICGALGHLEFDEEKGVTIVIDDLHQNVFSVDGLVFHTEETHGVRENIYNPRKHLVDDRLKKYKEWDMYNLKSPTKEARKQAILDRMAAEGKL